MGHTLEIPDETYQELMHLAAERGQTPVQVLQQWVKEIQQASSQQPAIPTHGTMNGQYDPAQDPLAPFLGAFEATAPDVVHRHDHYLGEAYADSHDTGK
jgi:hypothetical protein